MATATAASTASATTARTARQSLSGFVVGTVLLIALTLLVAELDRWIGAQFRAQGVANNPLEYPLTAVIIGLIANFVLRATRFFDYVQPAIRTELYVKIGLVLLGSRIVFGDMLKIGAGGLLQALVMVTSVFLFTWWLGGRVKLPDTLRAVMAAAVSICGVSAAIAAAGSVQAKKTEVTYVATLVILTALPLMVLLPPLASALGLSQPIAGAWFGGNIDTTAAVVGAGTIFRGDIDASVNAQSVASVVKASQNVLIGVVSFILALYFATVIEKKEGGERPSARVIWDRFPKFVIGFVLVSILVSTGAIWPELAKDLDTLSKWFFALAFVSIGLSFSLTDLRQAGWKPVGVYVAATVFNTVLALVVAYLIFGLLFPVTAL
jgi:uncharacterized integral membrane protein (TIGR00698 family)